MLLFIFVTYLKCLKHLELFSICRNKLLIEFYRFFLITKSVIFIDFAVVLVLISFAFVAFSKDLEVVCMTLKVH